MANNLRIGKTLLKCNSQGLPDNLFSAAVFINELKQVQHAGIFIRYNGVSKLFHYTGQEILLEDYFGDSWYFQKELSFIDSSLVPSILVHCEIVRDEANPKYGFFYMGSMYNENGDFISIGNMPEYMTCVGFCLNFIKYLNKGEDFFKYVDWTEKSLGMAEGYVEKFINKVKEIHPTINVEDFKAGIRRIFPLEYISGAFSNEIPVRKSFVDNISSTVKDVMIRQLTA